jgi:hypothetical protein
VTTHILTFPAKGVGSFHRDAAEYRVCKACATVALRMDPTGGASAHPFHDPLGRCELAYEDTCTDHSSR